MTKDQILEELITTEMAIGKLRAIADQLRQRLGFHAGAAVVEEARPKQKPPAKRHVSDAGRRALSKAMKRRWAEAKAKGTVLTTGRKKKAAA